jgi:hypothetical protein
VSQIQYPLQREDAGRAAWTIMHHRSSLYSDSPSEKDKKMMKDFLYENFRSIALLCKDCKKHIRDYLKSRPLEPALKNKKALSKYLCEFHNAVNERQGKDIVNCHLILGKKEECTDCNTNSIQKDLKSSFEDFKKASKKIFYQLCDRYNVPHPTIKFHACPNDVTSSCTSMWIDSRTNDVIEKPVVYLHPNVFGLRTIAHEFVHYIRQMGKDTLGAINEEGVEREAQAILNKEFPFDEIEKSDMRGPPITSQQLVVRHDYISRLRNFPTASRIYDKHLANVKRRDVITTDEKGDWIFDMLGGVNEGKDEGYEINTTINRRDDNNNSNALSFLDGLYSPFAALFGMKSSDLNRSNTPLILSNAALTLLRTHLSPIGALLASTVTSLGIFGALAFSRNGLSYGDKLLMNSFGNNFFWSALDYIRPENKAVVVEGAMDLGEAVSHQQWNVLPHILLGDTLAAIAGVGEVSTSTASPLSATRNIQRASLGGGSRGIGGTSSGTKRITRVVEPTRNIHTGAATGGNPALRSQIGGGSPNTMKLPENAAVAIPSDYEEEQYQSAFGMHVSDGRRGEIMSDPDYDQTRRNTIKDIFEADPNYDNFNDVYYEDEEIYG